MQFEDFSFGSIQIDGITHEHDVVIENGEIRKRKKKPSKKFRADFGHTPLSIEEDIPWKTMPPASRRHRSVWKAAGDERSKARSGESKGRIARAPDDPSY